jgi:hypothetical protein
MRTGQISKVSSQPPPACWGIHRLKADGKRLESSGLAQCEYLIAMQQRLECPAKLGPKFNLARD